MNMQRLSTRDGLLIVFIGPDGCGKTSVIERIATLLEKKRAIQPHIIHWRPAWLPHIGELFGKKIYSDPAYTDFTPHKAPPSHLIGSFMRLAYYTIDFTLGFFIRIKPLLQKGNIVIFDRYYYDFIVDPKRSRINLPEVVPRIMLKLVPQPDRVFFLDNDPEELFSRKQELSLNELHRQLIKYRELVLTINNALVLPKGLSIDELASRSVSEIMPDMDGVHDR